MSVHISCDWHITGSLNWWPSSRRSTQPPNTKGPDTTCAQSPSVTVGCSASWFWDVTDAAVPFPLRGLAGQVLCSGSVLTQRSADLGPPVLPYMFLCRVDADTWCLFCLPWEMRCDLGLDVRNCTGYTGTEFKLYMGHKKNCQQSNPEHRSGSPFQRWQDGQGGERSVCHSVRTAKDPESRTMFPLF